MKLGLADGENEMQSKNGDILYSLVLNRRVELFH